MCQVMDRETGDHRIKHPELWKGIIHIVRDDADARIAGKAGSHRLQHSRGKIDGDRLGLRIPTPRHFSSNQSQQSPIARSQIENAPHTRGDEFEQTRLALATMRNGICSLEILTSVLGGRPQIYRLGSSHDRKYRETGKLKLNE